MTARMRGCRRLVTRSPCRRTRLLTRKNQFLPMIKAALAGAQINGTITLSGYEGSELLVARLLIESGADVPYVGTACPKTPWNEADAAWLADKGVKVKYRASLEDDCAAMEAIKPDLAIGTTPVVQKGKELGIPSLIFHQPDFSAAFDGCGWRRIACCKSSMPRWATKRGWITCANSSKALVNGDTAGVWEKSPNVQPDFRATNAKKLERAAKAAKAAEMI